MPVKRKLDGSTAVSNVSLSELFSRLTLAASSNDFERVLSISNEMLKSSPNDARAARQKLVALIKLDKYKDALAFVEESTSLSAKDTLLERGFCLYKLGKCKEAQMVLKEGSGRAIQHVRAQNVLFPHSLSHSNKQAYRMEDFATAMKLYSDLEQSKGMIDHESEDLASNYSAARAQDTWTTGIGHEKGQEIGESYEVCFNKAYELIALGQLNEAEEALIRAESSFPICQPLTSRTMCSFGVEWRRLEG